jgi:hypothetical protein
MTSEQKEFTGEDSPKSEVTYAYNQRALKRWQKERLTISHNDDETVDALFQLAGSTCSNMGMPLSFDYIIKLTGPSEQYKITEMRCQPTEGHHGYKSMCSYLESPERILGSLENEKPLIGKTLNQALEWDAKISPAGCVCTQTSRNHKWNIVLQTLHFTLSQLTHT